MALHTPNQHVLEATNCHVCDKEIEKDQYAIEHMGFDFTMWLHPECATILMLRLGHDVIRVGRTDKHPLRVPEILRDVRKK